MVKINKTQKNSGLLKKNCFIYIFSLFLIFSNQLLSAQAASSSTESVENSSVNYSVANSAFENDTSYFEENPSGQGEQKTSKTPSTAGMIIKMIVVLALVIAALYGIMIFFKKKNNPAQSDDDFLRRVSSLNLSPGKSIEIVTLIDQGFILGVTDNNINLIAEIKDKELLSALNLNFDKKKNTKKPMNFNDVLEMFMPRRNQNTNTGSIYSSTEEVVENLSRNSIEENNENPNE